MSQVRHLNETMLKHQAIPHPGIGPIMPDDEIRRHAYYQWVPFVLFAQAISFYLPHLIWRSWEGGKIKSLVIGLQVILLSKHLANEEDLQINKTYVIYSKPTIEKKVNRTGGWCRLPFSPAHIVDLKIVSSFSSNESRLLFSSTSR
jgi:innexin